MTRPLLPACLGLVVAACPIVPGPPTDGGVTPDGGDNGFECLESWSDISTCRSTDECDWPRFCIPDGRTGIGCCVRALCDLSLSCEQADSCDPASERDCAAGELCITVAQEGSCAPADWLRGSSCEVHPTHVVVRDGVAPLVNAAGFVGDALIPYLAPSFTSPLIDSAGRAFCDAESCTGEIVAEIPGASCTARLSVFGAAARSRVIALDAETDTLLPGVSVHALMSGGLVVAAVTDRNGAAEIGGPILAALGEREGFVSAAAGAEGANLVVLRLPSAPTAQVAHVEAELAFGASPFWAAIGGGAFTSVEDISYRSLVGAPRGISSNDPGSAGTLLLPEGLAISQAFWRDDVIVWRRRFRRSPAVWTIGAPVSGLEEATNRSGLDAGIAWISLLGATASVHGFVGRPQAPLQLLPDAPLSAVSTREVGVPPLPCSNDGTCTRNVVVVAMSDVPALGLVPVAVAAAEDTDGDGVVEPSGDVLLRQTVLHDGLEGTATRTFVFALEPTFASETVMVAERRSRFPEPDEAARTGLIASCSTCDLIVIEFSGLSAVSTIGGMEPLRELLTAVAPETGAETTTIFLWLSAEVSASDLVSSDRLEIVRAADGWVSRDAI